MRSGGHRTLHAKAWVWPFNMTHADVRLALGRSSGWWFIVAASDHGLFQMYTRELSVLASGRRMQPHVNQRAASTAEAESLRVWRLAESENPGVAIGPRSCAIETESAATGGGRRKAL